MNTLLYTEAEISDKAFSALSYTLRKEYQPKSIAVMANSNDGSKKFIVGCGGGKTLMMALGVAYQVMDGNAKKVVITAPSIRLCRQLEEEFVDIFAKLNIKKYINFVNVSCDRKKSKDLDDDDVKEEHNEEEDDDKVVKKNHKNNVGKLCTEMGWHRDTMVEHTKIKTELLSNNITIFFVCKPSFLKNFRFRVRTIIEDINPNFKIDITCHDEFHNFISTEKKQKCRSSLQTYGTFSRNNWFFSASKKSTEGLCWTDALFGELVDDVSSSQLVKWGYLVPELKIYIVTADTIKNVDFSVQQKFEAMYKAKASDFLREAKVVLKVTEHQTSQAETTLRRPSMKGLLFSKRVAFTKEMKNNPEFGTRIRAFNSNFTLFQMDGSTGSENRDTIFKDLRNLSDDCPAWLLQHSVCREGINAPNFDVSILARGMGEISMQQALGRIQRMYEGKDCAYLYIYVDDNDYEESMKGLAAFLHYNLGNYKATVEKLVDDTSGSSNNNDDDNEDTMVPNLSSVKVALKDPMIIIQEHQLELVNIEKEIAEEEARDSKSVDELIAELSFMQ